MTTVTRLAIVTGAASGLGRAFCLRLAAAPGWHVAACDVDDAGGRETIDLMRNQQGRAAGEFVRLDVTDRSAWGQLADRVSADVAAGRLPPPSVLVNNAGVCAAAEILGSDPEQWRRIMEVNFFGVLNGCQAIGPLLRQAVGALKPQASSLKPSIINVASIAAYLAAPSMGAYSASKAAVVALSEALFAELRPAGVGVTVVAPGFFRTGLLDRGDFCSDRHRAQAEKLSRNARFTADDVARAALAAAARGRLYCVMGARGRWLWRAKRLAPTSLFRIIARGYDRTFREGERGASAGD